MAPAICPQNSAPMLADVKFALRRLWKTPGFSAAALATLALCIGANLAIFAVLDAILIRSLPFPRADRLVTLYYVYPKLPSAHSGASLTNYYERRGKIAAFSSIAEISMNTSVVGEVGATSIEKLGRVTPEFFSTLGVAPLLGRAFRDDEMTYQSDQEAVLSYEFWKARYGGDPQILGKMIRMDGLNRRIVGVLPPSFRFLSFRAPVYMPLSSEEGERNIGARHSLGNTLVARLADGSTLGDARAQVDALDAQLAPLFLDAKIVADAGCHTLVAPLQADFVASARPMLLSLQAGALLLLAIGCVNIVNLLLIRASNRTRELAIRRALGADPRAIVRETLTETLLLTAVGGLLGLGAGCAGIRLLALFGAESLPLGAEIAFNGTVAAAALLGALAIGLSVGVPVAWINLHGRLAAALQAETRGSSSGPGAARLRQGFIVAQVALAFILLTGAGLLGLSLKRAMEVQPGFQPDHVVTGQFNLTWSAYHVAKDFSAFFNRLYETVSALPGVAAVGSVNTVPVVGQSPNDAVTVPGYTPKPGDSLLVNDVHSEAGDYFKAMGIPLMEGRFLRPEDERWDGRVCVVDEAFARHYWPGESALGKTFYRGTHPDPKEEAYRIVGVVGSIRQESLTDLQARGAVYYPYTEYFSRNFYLVVRSALPAEALAPILQKAVRSVDSDMPLTDVRSMDLRIEDSLITRRSPALMAGLFAATALLLATIGLYGVMAYAVAQRTREFGVRMALGAQSRDVLRLVFLQGARLAAIGIGLGAVGASLLTGFMASLLYGVKANDPLAYVGVAALLAAVAAAACLLPARRATRVDPVVALRAE
jgi:predicted permease